MSGESLKTADVDHDIGVNEGDERAVAGGEPVVASGCRPTGTWAPTTVAPYDAATSAT